MSFRIDLYVHHQSRDESAIAHRLGNIEAILKSILFKEEQMAGELDALKVDVAESVDVQNSAIVLLNGLKAALDAAIASGDPAALTALSASLDSTKDALAAAIVANTPAAP